MLNKRESILFKVLLWIIYFSTCIWLTFIILNDLSQQKSQRELVQVQYLSAARLSVNPLDYQDLMQTVLTAEDILNTILSEEMFLTVYDFGGLIDQVFNHYLIRIERVNILDVEESRIEYQFSADILKFMEMLVHLHREQPSWQVYFLNINSISGTNQLRGSLRIHHAQE